MSFSKKIVTTYSKSLFQSLNEIQKKNNFEDSLNTLKCFEISKITSLTEKQPKEAITIYGIGEELSILSSVFISSKKLKTLFNNPTIPESQKLALLLNIFPGLTPIMRSFLKILSERSHLCLLPDISSEYNDFLLKFKSCTKVKLITASILQENYGLLLLKTLKSLTKSKEVILSVSFNPQLLGGLILEYNSTSTDASILKEFSLFFTET